MKHPGGLTLRVDVGLSTAMSDVPAALRAWRAVVESHDLALLDSLLADDVVFRSPAVFAPQEGKASTGRAIGQERLETELRGARWTVPSRWRVISRPCQRVTTPP
jgi:hypothetical protein